MRRAPFPPLLANGAALRSSPEEPVALARRMAEVYGVAEDEALPVRGRLHGLELIFRLVAIEGRGVVVCAASNDLERLAAITRISLSVETGPLAGAVIVEPGFDPKSAVGHAADIAPALLVVDESDIEFSDIFSLAVAAKRAANLVVIRSLESAYGLSGAPCGALIAAPALILRLKSVVEPFAVPSAIAGPALSILEPVRMIATRDRIERVKRERARMTASLKRSPIIEDAEAEGGPSVRIRANKGELMGRARAWKIDVKEEVDGAFRIPVGDEDENDRLLAAFGAIACVGNRRKGEVVRETRETRIIASVDLDRAGGADIDTGVGYFDHMLAQIVQHAGFSVILTCRGDLDVDAHHTIEDCTIAFGEALRIALGDRRGIARYGFTLPMDEAEASVSIDLGGRPYLVFEGAFSAPLIGEYPTEMTKHVFLSLAQSLGAAIHIRVTGENNHHKTEACFKAFARALRAAIRIESDETPSTKGAIL
ncbi:MAG: imidazoleglycerol-phosphate dehydratase HisB [Pseudomonadota bacterium]